MLDLLFIGITILFFVVALAYVRGCEKLPLLHDHSDAGSGSNLAWKKAVPRSLGTFPVTTLLFTTLLVSVIVIVGALTFFPALSLGPIAEHLLMHGGVTF